MFDVPVFRQHFGVLTPFGRELADSRHTAAVVMPSGVLNHSGLSPLVAAFMNAAHSGTATSLAKPLGRIVRGWSKPTQTPATSFGVKPTNHASL